VTTHLFRLIRTFVPLPRPGIQYGERWAALNWLLVMEGDEL
jgi:hypothetical protein